MLKIYLQHIVFCILIYISIFCFIYLIQDELIKNGLIGNKINLSDSLSKKTSYLISQIENKNLAINFLENKRTLTPEQKISFQSSGLIHLLAVSGGQIIPLCKFVSFFFMNFAYFFLSRYFSSKILMRILMGIKNCVAVLVAFIITSMFSCAGALLRVAFLSALYNFLKFRKSTYLASFLFPMISDHFIRRCLLLLLVSICFGNMYLDYSFLLSSIGATSVEILAFILNCLYKKIKLSFRLKKIIAPILLTFLTSWTISILLYPVCRVPLFASGFSNVLAAPIVTFVITPISLLLIIFPINFFLSDLLIIIFDNSLQILEFVSNVFQDPYYSIKIPKILLFSDEGLIYLVSVLMILFSISDIIRTKDLLYLQFRTTEINCR